MHSVQHVSHSYVEEVGEELYIMSVKVFHPAGWGHLGAELIPFQDLGNTNFSIHLPRTSFDRHATGNLVLRAVQSLGIDARVNERNDICIEANKISCLHLNFSFHIP